jgi:hypothetical protein
MPEKRYLLDGCSRLAAIERAFSGDPETYEAVIEVALVGDTIGDGATISVGDDDNYRDIWIAPPQLLEGVRIDGSGQLVPNIDPFSYVVSVNVRRRHLTSEQKRDIVAALLKAHPERSDRETAKLAKVSPTTVGVIRGELEEAGAVSKLDTRTGADGVQQPARKLGAHARQITRDELDDLRLAAPREADAPIEHLADRKDAVRVLDEAIRFLAQRRPEVMALPISTRIGRAMSVLDALGIGVDQLVPAGRR